MIRNLICRASVKVLLALTPLAIGGCGSGDQGGEKVANTGTLSMPLVTSANGHTYRLTAQIEISGPTFQFLNTGDETVLTTELQTGNYSAILFGFQLQRLDDLGVYAPVTATLLSDGFQSFQIYNQADTTVSFQFQTDGAIVTTGTGKLHIDVGVTEKAPICTILGSGCPDGSWCAPPGLTGAALACLPSGGAPIGGACTSPSACQSNASCYDFGSGPVCAALCSSAEFGAACTHGGTCTAAAADYGVCVPDGAIPPGGGEGGANAGGGAAAGAAGE
jgi:hypothetical protein